MLLINFKAYEQAMGDKAVEIAKIAAEISKKTSKRIAVVPNFVDLRQVSKVVEAFAPHVDPFEPGSHTGSVVPNMIGFAKGVVLNHTEKPVLLKDLEASIRMAKKLGLETVVCANNVAVAADVTTFKPDHIALEPPELIGGDISVSTAEPDIIKKAVDAIGSQSKVLVGAGIKTRKDVEIAIELGAKGVFVASGIVKADNIKYAIKELADGLK
jgi:triosephosphate isomerase